jgi:hypothetical protein
MLEVRHSGGLRDDARQSNVLDSSWFLVMICDKNIGCQYDTSQYTPR